MGLIRGSALQGFGELVADLDGDPSALLAWARIPAGAVGDQDAFISDRAVMAVLEAAAERTGAPDFGRRLALRQGLEILGPVGVAARTAATVGDALAAVDEYTAVYSPSLSVRVEPEAGGRSARFDWRVLTPRPPRHVQAAELGVGVSLRIFRLLAGPGFTPRSVHFRHEAQGSPVAYRQYFHCRTRFGDEFTGFVFDAKELARPLSTDHGVHDVVKEYLSGLVAPAEGPDLEPVRLLIRRMLPTGGLTLDLVADNLALHPRTLQRRLADQGTSFAAVLDDVRREEADHYLRRSTMPLSQLSGLLGYSEQSTLTRSCRRWFGCSPLARRRQLGAPGAGSG